MSGQRKLEFTKETITEAAFNELNMKLTTVGTVLMSFKLSIGKVSIAQKNLFTNEAIVSLPVKDNSLLDTNYLARALENFNFNEIGNRAAMGKTRNTNNTILAE